MKKTGRNESCPCGSGKKYKKCCLLKKPENRKNIMDVNFLDLPVFEEWLKVTRSEKTI
ncbi:SEC-C metal-binding domain-containing protein [Gimesia maris]|uniref:SEC-C metal-binding domain-containing protein n=1 Tax=Gimesia maris TaxID=122 RepID=UPI003C6D0C88|tara:strand:+ start:121515 stop:121688 length:174 start_codon:yes stop_codon:yes gene_type:complete